jgi:PAS domain S-box-containing protein
MKLGLTSRIALSFVLLSATLLATVGVLSYRSGSKSLEADAMSETLSKAVETEAGLNAWISERLSDIGEIAGQADVVEKAARLIAAPPGSAEARSAHDIVLQELEPHVSVLSSNFVEMFVIGAESGKVVASTTASEEGKSKFGHPYFDRGKTNLYLQPLYSSADEGVPAMTAGIPMRASDGRVVAILAGRFNLASINVITQRRTGLHQTEDSFLFNAEKFALTQPRFMTEPAVLRRKIDTQAVRLCIAHNNGVVVAPDYRGVPSIAAYRWNTNNQFGLIVKIDKIEALAPARAFGWSLGLIGIFALVAAIVIASVVARTITKPLNTLTTRVRNFAEKDVRGPLRASSEDEVSVLAGEFDRMAGRVAERTAELAKSNDALQVENAERKQIEEILQQRVTLAELEADVGTALTKGGTLAEMLRQCCEAIVLRLDGAFARVWTLNEKENMLELEASAGIYTHLNGPHGRVPVGKFKIGLIAEERKPHLTNGVVGDPRVGDQEWAKREGMVAFAGYPLILEDRVVGVVAMFARHTLTEASLQAMASISNNLAMGIERKRVEEQLRWKTALLEAQVDSSLDGILVVNENNKKILQNERTVELLKLPQHIAENEGGMQQLQWVTERVKNAAQFIEKVKYIRAHPNEITRDEVEFKDGTILDRYSSPVVGKDGKSYGRIFAFRDITERKRAEDALRESEEKFRQLADNITEVFWMTSPDLKQIHYISPGYERIWGRSMESLYANPHQWVDAIVPAEREHAFAAFASLMGNASEADVEYRIARPDGALRWIHDRGFQVRDSEGKVIRLAGFASDVTARKLSEEKLKLFRSLIDRSHDGIIVADAVTGHCLDANESGYRMLGYSRDEMMALTAFDVTAGLDRSKFEAANAKIEEKGHAVVEIHHQRKDGTIFPSETTLSFVNLDRTYLVAIVRDITERKRTEAELETSHKQLLEASRMAGMAEIASSVLHNVGNVLNSVNISTDIMTNSIKKSKVSSLGRVVVLLQEHAHDLGEFLTQDPSGQHVPTILARLSEHLMAEEGKISSELDSLRRNVEHIKEIVAMQQNYARAGGVKETIDLTTLVEDSLRLNEGAFRRHGVEVVRELAKIPPMNVEKHKILQILVNLVRNAKYACDESGHANGRLTMRMTNGDGTVKISVIDNGIGIPPENLTRIFNHGFTTRKSGHGFGLHSSALAAKEMGGSLSVCSGGLGQGATFTLELPCPTEESPHE